MSGGIAPSIGAQPPTTIQQQYVHGIKTDLPNAIHVLDDAPTWIYIAGTQVVYHAPTAKVQRFAQCPPVPGYKSTLTALQVSNDKKWIAVAEFLEHPSSKTDQKTQLSFFDAESGKRKRTILYGDSSSLAITSSTDTPNEDISKEKATGGNQEKGATTSSAAVTVKVSPITHIAFSADAKQIACLTASSELSYWLWGKNKVLAMQQLKGSWTGGVSIDPSIGTQIALSGPSGIWVGRYSEGKIVGTKVWEEETSLIGHVWVQENHLVAATKSSFSLLQIESSGSTLTADRQVAIDAYIPPAVAQHPHLDKAIFTTCLSATPDGFVCGTSVGGIVKYQVTPASTPSSNTEGEDASRYTLGTPATTRVKEALQLPDEQYLAILSVASVAPLASPEGAAAPLPEQHAKANYRAIFITEDRQVWADGPAEVNAQTTSSPVSSNADAQKTVSKSNVNIAPSAPPSTSVVRSVLAGPHAASIASSCLCLRRPLLATLSATDHTLKLWNYLTHTLELTKSFVADDVSMVSLHPSGLYLLLGGTDKIRLYALLVDEVRLVKEYAIRGCKEIKFSNGGQCFAIACATQIYILPTFPPPVTNTATSSLPPGAAKKDVDPLSHASASAHGIMNAELAAAAAAAKAAAVNQVAAAPAECSMVLKGHNGRIRSLVFTKDDSRLISAGTDGAIYTWNLANGRREAEHILKGCGYAAAVPALRQTIVKATDHGDAIELGPLAVYAVGTDSLIKEIVDGQVTKEVECNVGLSALAINNASTHLVVGTTTGSLRLFKLDAAAKLDSWEEIGCHSGAVTKVLFSNDDKAIFSVGEDGCLYQLALNERNLSGLGGRDYQVTFSDELLMTKTDLQERAAIMAELRTRLEELKLEHEYQLRLRDMSFSEKSKDLNERFLIEVETLKISYGSFKDDLMREEAANAELLQRQRDKQSVDQHDVEQKNSEIMMGEYEKYEKLQQETQRIQKNWEVQAKAIDTAKANAIDAITNENESKLRKYQHELSKISEEARHKRRENAEHAQQHDEDIDSEIQKLQHAFERQFREEREMAMRYKGENGVMRKKFGSLEKEVEENEAEKKRIESEHRKLLDAIKQLEKQINELKKAVQDRDKAILEKEHKVYELKKNNQELEKFKFVLDYRIKELKLQIEPRETQIAGMTGEIRLMDTEISRSNEHQQQLRALMASLQKQLEDVKVSSISQREQAHKNENHMHEARFDLTEAVQFIQEPQVLMRHTERLKKKYAAMLSATKLPKGGKDETSNGVGLAGALTLPPAQANLSTLLPSAIHRPLTQSAKAPDTEDGEDIATLEASVAALRAKLVENQAIFRQDNLNTLRENQSMIKEINQLRKEIKDTQRIATVSPAKIISIKKVSQLEAEKARGLPKLHEYQASTSSPVGTRTPRLPAIQDSPMTVRSYHQRSSPSPSRPVAIGSPDRAS